MRQENLRILIVRTDRIGDVVLTLPMAKVLRERFPNAHIAMLIRRYTGELVEDCPDVNEIIYYDEGKKLVPFFQLVSSLRSRQFDIVFHTYPRYRLAFMTWFAGIPIRVGTGYRWYSFFFNRKVFDHRKTGEFHELEYNIRLLESVGFDAKSGGIAVDVTPVICVKSDARNTVEQLLRTKGVTASDKIVIVHPGSGGSARDWSPVNFGKLAKRLVKLPGVKVVITGGNREHSVVDIVATAAGPAAIELVDAVTLRQYAALASMASVFVGNSSGPIHIAAATGTPVVGLYPHLPALSERRWGPYTPKRTVFAPVGKPPDCTICTTRGSSRCECMDSITVEEVYHAVVHYVS